MRNDTHSTERTRTPPRGAVTHQGTISWGTYGCAANQADSEMMKGLLKEAGFEFTTSRQDADVIVINTCTVKEATFHRMLHKIQEVVNAGKPLLVAGCMPKTERSAIEKIAPYASLIGPNSTHKIVHAVSETLTGKKSVQLQEVPFPKVGLPRIRKNDVIAICPIATGCLGHCSFCQTKLAKGDLLSYPLPLILDEVKASLQNGCKEIWLTAQDTGCYGFDLGTDLSILLTKIVKIPEEFFVRVGMMNPQHVLPILDDLLDSYESDKIFKFLHLPVQSGSNRILKRMNRNYHVSDVHQIIRKFKDAFEYLTLSTDIIVGFPGETHSDFQLTLNLIKGIKPDIVNISKFGKRAGTEAAKMSQVPKPIISERIKKLVELCKRTQLENNEKWIGWKGKVLLDKKGKRMGVIGRNFAYKPILTRGSLGSFKAVQVLQARPTFLIGE
ncbi:MAG: tRNA (N(6)-L-threonylcarbamoyladenosine(37)-C(2))-methylthiotransferase [Candidatus Heimdallarchaeota archaeon]